MSREKKKVSKAEFQELSLSEDEGLSLNSLEHLSEIELPIRVEFSRVKMSLERVLSLKEGNIVKLNRFAGEAVDIYVGNKLFAKGEVVVVDDKFGVRLIEIISPVA